MTNVLHYLHYLHDFLLISAPGSSECDASLSTMIGAFDHLGVPVAVNKLEGPTTVLSFLEIEIDTMAMQLCLPARKLAKLRALLQEWKGHRSCRRRELQSLLGKLQHACKVVGPGRSFLRRLCELLAWDAKSPPSHSARGGSQVRHYMVVQFCGRIGMGSPTWNPPAFSIKCTPTRQAVSAVGRSGIQNGQVASGAECEVHCNPGASTHCFGLHGLRAEMEQWRGVQPTVTIGPLFKS